MEIPGIHFHIESESLEISTSIVNNQSSSRMNPELPTNEISTPEYSNCSQIVDQKISVNADIPNEIDQEEMELDYPISTLKEELTITDPSQEFLGNNIASEPSDTGQMETYVNLLHTVSNKPHPDSGVSSTCGGNCIIFVF